MRPSGKSRNKNRNNGRRPNPGNVINRVFDSAGPEGKVRGTPQQIIDKYAEDMDYTDFAAGETRSGAQISPYTSDKPKQGFPV